jgi:hypothetical protein
MADPSATGDGLESVRVSGAVRVPDSLDRLLSPAWLTAALGTRFPGIIECAGGLPEGLSADLCAKGYYSAAGEAFRHAGEPEACFYRDVAPRTGIRTLRCVYADVDLCTRHSVTWRPHSRCPTGGASSGTWYVITSTTSAPPASTCRRGTTPGLASAAASCHRRPPRSPAPPPPARPRAGAPAAGLTTGVVRGSRRGPRCR